MLLSTKVFANEKATVWLGGCFQNVSQHMQINEARSARPPVLFGASQDSELVPQPLFLFSNRRPAAQSIIALRLLLPTWLSFLKYTMLLKNQRLMDG